MWLPMPETNPDYSSSISLHSIIKKQYVDDPSFLKTPVVKIALCLELTRNDLNVMIAFNKHTFFDYFDYFF